MTETTTLPIADIADADYNPRVISDEAFAGLVETIREYGLVQPLVVNRRTVAEGWPRDEFVLVGGHQRKKALLHLGKTEAEAHVVDLDPVDEKALNAALNNPHITGEFTTDLAKILDVVKAAKGDTYQRLQLEKMRGLKQIVVDKYKEKAEAPDDSDGSVDGDTAPEYVPDSKPGEVYELGPHRLACGDCTDLDLLAKLMDGRKADIVVTDPPYNIAEENTVMAAGVNESFEGLKNADWDKGFQFADVGPSILAVLADDASVYVFTSHHVAPDIWAFMKGDEFKHNGWCVWHKPNPMPSMAKRHPVNDVELVPYATRGKHTFNYPQKGHASSVWTFGKSKKNELHPTQKPVEVMAHPIGLASNPGDVVVDLFLGSGTTMMAAQSLGRVCCGTELSPLYCDRIRRRWTMYAHENGIDVGRGALYVRED